MLCKWLDVGDLTPPSPPSDGVFSQPLHARGVADHHGDFPNCSYLLNGRASVQCTSEVTLELRIYLLCAKGKQRGPVSYPQDPEIKRAMYCLYTHTLTLSWCVFMSSQPQRSK